MKPVRVQKGAFLLPFCTPFAFIWSRFARVAFTTDRVYATAVSFVSEANTRASSAACRNKMKFC